MSIYKVRSAELEKAIAQLQSFLVQQQACISTDASLDLRQFMQVHVTNIVEASTQREAARPAKDIATVLRDADKQIVPPLQTHAHPYLRGGASVAAGFNPSRLTPRQVGKEHGWSLLHEGDEMREGDGFWHPDYKMWLDFQCRPDVMRNPDRVNTFPVRRKKGQ